MSRRWTDGEIRTLALQTALKPYWRKRKEFAPGALDSPLSLLPIRPELVVREILGLTLEEPDEILPSTAYSTYATPRFGGILDRTLKKITVPRDLPPKTPRPRRRSYGSPSAWPTSPRRTGSGP